MNHPFKPRPEAQATTWDALMPPVQMAVHDLLVRIYGAHLSVRDKNTGKSADSSIQQTGNCFLVYGSRGTGKTTVLLNAQRAVCQKSGKTFFKELPDETRAEKEARKTQETPDETKPRKAEENARNNAESLRKNNVIWLEILNLEPVPSEANLLTVLLTQVRNALHSHCDKRQRDQRSIFEEEANSAQQLLNKLINDTTLMWQNISEPDTRAISARQVKAADIYAGFPEKFKKAMDKLIEELSDTRGSDSNVSIVLPIDNIDRSTEHLQSIVKLAQLVSHPNLWLVMSGDRVEVETFLERAYWKELIRSSDSAGARGKIDSEGEDEALVMARRQANATAQKLWPANHRVEINFMTSEETLKFEYKQDSATNTSKKIKELLEVGVNHANDEETLKVSYEYKKYFSGNEKDDKSIRGMLANIQIPTTENQRKLSEGDKSTVTLLKLFDVTNEVVKEPNDKKYLTRAAHHGLSLPARSVLDLWQLLDWLVHDVSSSGRDYDYRAEKIARTMLRTAISSSVMPSAMAQDLQNDIIRRGEKGGTVLFFGDTSLKVIAMTSANHDFEHALKPVFLPEKTKSNFPYLRSQLVIRNIEDIVLRLHNYSPIKKFDSSKNQYPQPFVIENASERQLIELPPLVAAWLMVLHDILMLAEAEATSWVIGCSQIEFKYPNVAVQHTILNKKNKKRDVTLFWTPPDWRLFLGRNIFRLRWQNIRQEISRPNLQDKNLVTRLLAAGWVYCVLKTSVELINSIDAQCLLPILEFKNKLDEFKKSTEGFNNNSNKFTEIAAEFEKNTDEFTTIEAESMKNTAEAKEKFNGIVKSFNKNVQEFEKLLSNKDVNSPARTFNEDVQKFKSKLLKSALKNSVPEVKVTDEDFETKIINAVHNFYQMVQETKKLQSTAQSLIIPAAYEVMIKTGKWLETELVYLLSSACVPIDTNLSPKNPLDKNWKDSGDDTLHKYWHENLRFILAEQEKRLADAENESKQKTLERSKDDNIEPLLGTILFADLYKKLSE